MGITFDGATKVMTLTFGTTSLGVRDLYSRWKDWVQVSDNSKWIEAFVTAGGEDVDIGAGTKIPAYAFLVNGWRLKPQEAHHTLNVSDGILLVSGGGDPFVNTTGSYVVRVNYQQPVQAIAFSTGEVTAATCAAAVWATVLEAFMGDEVNAKEAMRLMLANAAGNLSGGGTLTETIKSALGHKDRLVAAVDASGNRTVTKDVTD